MNAKDDLGGQNLEADNLGGEDLGGMNENAQNVVEINVDENVTVVNVEDDNPRATAFEPTNPKSNKSHGNTTSAVLLKENITLKFVVRKKESSRRVGCAWTCLLDGILLI
ncbi:hypothetical protein ACLOJK_028001 [Asimina triloba]